MLLRQDRHWLKKQNMGIKDWAEVCLAFLNLEASAGNTIMSGGIMEWDTNTCSNKRSLTHPLSTGCIQNRNISSACSTVVQNRRHGSPPFSSINARGRPCLGRNAVRSFLTRSSAATLCIGATFHSASCRVIRLPTPGGCAVAIACHIRSHHSALGERWERRHPPCGVRRC